MKFRTVYDNDVYIRLEYIHHSQLSNFFKSSLSLLTTNISVDRKLFKKQLVSHIKTFSNKSLSSNQQSRYGIHLCFMLDVAHSVDQLVALSEKIMGYYGNLPYFSYCTTKGRATYLNFFVSLRPYYPEAKECFSVASHDVFYDKVTGRTCKRDNPNAVLRTAKGSVIEKTRSVRHFGDVVRRFDYASSRQFKADMLQTKSFYVETLKEVCGSNITDDLSLPKFSLDKARRKPQKTCRSIWNRSLCNIEKSLHELWVSMKLCSDASCAESVEKFENLRLELIKTLQIGIFSVRIGNSKPNTVYLYDYEKYMTAHIRYFKTKNYRRTKDDAYFFEVFANKKINALRTELFGSFNDWCYL